MDLPAQLETLQRRIAEACTRAGRSPDSVLLLAVSKGMPPEMIRAAADLGLVHFGENKVQEAKAKIPLCPSRLRWHMIGHLQSNKVLKAAQLFTGVDSVDSVRLAEKLHAAAQQLGKKLPVLIEVNVGGESAKSGVEFDSPELEQMLNAAPRLSNLEFRGLMTIRHLRELRDQIATRKLSAVHLETLSMGMSHDFEVAIEEGSTCVRVGTAVFGGRPRK